MGGGGKKTPLSKIGYTYLTIIKLGTVILPTEDSKIYKSRKTPLESCCLQYFSPETILTFIEFLKVILINVIAVLMMSVKLATPGLLESGMTNF